MWFIIDFKINMLLIVIVFMAIVILIAGMIIIFLYRKVSGMDEVEHFSETHLTEPDDLIHDVSVRDVLRLVNTSFMEEIDTLLEESNISNKQPVFYAKYQGLTKNNRDAYFQNLMEILSKNEPGFVDRLMTDYPDISTQDILLLLLHNAHLENKLIAKVLFINTETLKKRKTRLKAKMGGMMLHSQNID